MPEGISLEAMVDIGVQTRAFWKQDEFYQIATNYTQYPFVSRFLIGAVKELVPAGTAYEWRVLTAHNNSARQTKPFARRSGSQSDGFVKALMPGRLTEWYWQYEYHQVMANIKSRMRIINFMNSERLKGNLAGLEHMEKQAWGKPSSSENDEDVWGVQYWVTRGPSGQEGFLGGNPDGFSDRAGISSTTYPNNMNWSASYSAVSKTDLIMKIKRAAMSVNFSIPLRFAEEGLSNEKPSHILCCGRDLILSFELAAEQQNVQLGNDLAETSSKAQLLRMKFEYVPFLNSDTTNPLYMLNMKCFKPRIWEGDNFRETKPIPWSENSDVYNVFTTVMWNIACEDVRSNAVLFKA